MINDMWNSFTWATAHAGAWVFDVVSSWWESSPLSLLLFVIAVLFALIVTFRRAD